MKLLIYTILLPIIIIGCATYSQVFINSDGQMMQCSSTGQGIIGMAVAENAEKSCEMNLRSAGYLPLKEAGVIGIRFSQTKNDTAAMILQVFDNSPAKATGIKPGDRVIMVSNQTINSAIDASHLLFGKAGTNVEVVILRGTERISLTITRASYTQVYGNP